MGHQGLGKARGETSHEAAGSPPALGLAVGVVFAIAGVVMAQVLPVSVWGGSVCEAWESDAEEGHGIIAVGEEEGS